MKLKVTGNNIDAVLTNNKGEAIYTYQVGTSNIELDVTKFIESVGDLAQTIQTLMEMERAKPAVHNDDDVE